MTAPGPWALADTDPVGDALEWVNTHADLSVLLRGAGPPDNRVGPRSAPPYPRARVTDVDGDLGGFTGLRTNVLSVEWLGDLDHSTPKAALGRIAVAGAEVFRQLTHAGVVGETVFTQVLVGGLSWAPLPPHDQDRWLMRVSLWSHPVQRLA